MSSALTRFEAVKNNIIYLLTEAERYTRGRLAKRVVGDCVHVSPDPGDVKGVVEKGGSEISDGLNGRRFARQLFDDTCDVHSLINATDTVCILRTGCRSIAVVIDHNNMLFYFLRIHAAHTNIIYIYIMYVHVRMIRQIRSSPFAYL